MSIVDKVKRMVPKTPKQWAIAGLGTAAAALGVDYAIRKDDSLVMRLVHRFHHGGGGGHPHHGHHRRHVAPHPGVVPMYAPAYPPPEMVFVEPSYANPFFYEFRNHGYGHPHGHEEHYQHVPQHPAAQGHGAPHMGSHHVGAASDPPHAPKQAKAKIPPPGAYGIVSVTPQAAGVVMGEFSDAPCGPGLYYDEQNQRCVPVPTTPPYGWRQP